MMEEKNTVVVGDEYHHLSCVERQKGTSFVLLVNSRWYLRRKEKREVLVESRFPISDVHLVLITGVTTSFPPFQYHRIMSNSFVALLLHQGRLSPDLIPHWRVHPTSPVVYPYPPFGWYPFVFTQFLLHTGNVPHFRVHLTLHGGWILSTEPDMS